MYSYLELEQAVEYFSILGGMESLIELDYFDDVFSMVESNFVQQFSRFENLVTPSFLLESPYKEILTAVARGDGKLYSVLKKAKFSEAAGEQIVEELIALNVLRVESSRELGLREYAKQKRKKEQRAYRVQDKLRFVQPFMRFWFGFVVYYRKELMQKKGEAFLENFNNHYERLRSLVYEQLCDVLLIEHFLPSVPIVNSGSLWDIHSEFDIYAMNEKKKIILGECKYKDRKVCKNELSKLKAKAEQSGIVADIYVLFSKSGFSNELLQAQDKDLLLFDLNDLKVLCS